MGLHRALKYDPRDLEVRSYEHSRQGKKNRPKSCTCQCCQSLLRHHLHPKQEFFCLEVVLLLFPEASAFTSSAGKGWLKFLCPSEGFGNGAGQARVPGHTASHKLWGRGMGRNKGHLLELFVQLQFTAALQSSLAGWLLCSGCAIKSGCLRLFVLSFRLQIPG